jgi:hypothetical protein
MTTLSAIVILLAVIGAVVVVVLDAHATANQKREEGIRHHGRAYWHGGDV